MEVQILKINFLNFACDWSRQPLYWCKQDTYICILFDEFTDKKKLIRCDILKDEIYCLLETDIFEQQHENCITNENIKHFRHIFLICFLCGLKYAKITVWKALSTLRDITPSGMLQFFFLFFKTYFQLMNKTFLFVCVFL